MAKLAIKTVIRFITSIPSPQTSPILINPNKTKPHSF